jgi:hypothetical protein
VLRSRDVSVEHKITVSLRQKWRFGGFSLTVNGDICRLIRTDVLRLRIKMKLVNEVVVGTTDVYI